MLSLGRQHICNFNIKTDLWNMATVYFQEVHASQMYCGNKTIPVLEYNKYCCAIGFNKI